MPTAESHADRAERRPTSFEHLSFQMPREDAASSSQALRAGDLVFVSGQPLPQQLVEISATVVPAS